MPELPEVETIVRGLRKKIIGKKIAAVKVVDGRILTGISAREFVRALTSRRIQSIARRAKYIIVRLDNGKILLVHLGMTGGLVFRRHGIDVASSAGNISAAAQNRSGTATVKYIKWQARFSDGSYLYYLDARLFGEIRLVDARHIADLHLRLGPEPLSRNFKFAKFLSGLQKRKTNIKALLLNQLFLSGVGNIYATEALFLAGISPLRRADRIKKEEARKLFDSIKKVLAQGIKHRCHRRSRTVPISPDSKTNFTGISGILPELGHSQSFRGY
jgi:formamidopyrimidine-DNA glycosylase